MSFTVADAGGDNFPLFARRNKVISDRQGRVIRGFSEVFELIHQPIEIVFRSPRLTSLTFGHADSHAHRVLAGGHQLYVTLENCDLKRVGRAEELGEIDLQSARFAVGAAGDRWRLVLRENDGVLRTNAA